MKELIYGTTNPAKVAQVKDILEPLGFQIRSLADFDKEISVEEDGRTAEDNARKKAIAYSKAFNEPVLSMDIAFYISGLLEDEQPGLHVRRIKSNERATDQELIDRYAALATKLGGRTDAYWRYAFALAWPNGTCASFNHDSPNHDSPRILVSTPTKKVVEGFPTESLLLDPDNDKYISELTEDEMAAFWQKTVGNPLIQFVQENY